MASVATAPPPAVQAPPSSPFVRFVLPLGLTLLLWASLAALVVYVWLYVSWVKAGWQLVVRRVTEAPSADA